MEEEEEGVHVAYGGGGEVYRRLWLRKQERKRQFGRPGRRWEDDIRMDL